MHPPTAPTSLHPDDLRLSAAICREALAPALAANWSVKAGDLDWDCRRTLDHIADSLAFYAIHLATRATTRKMPPRNGAPTRRPGEPSDVPELFDMVEGMAAVLADVAKAAPVGTRAFHPAGMGDPEGFVAMGCEEILIHTDDIAAGLGVPFAPPPDLAARVVRRLFPGRRPTSSPGWRCAGPAAGRRCPIGSGSAPTGGFTARRSPNGTERSSGGRRRRPGRSACRGRVARMSAPPLVASDESLGEARFIGD